MKFSTQVPLAKAGFQIDYHSKLVSLGSCFAVNIAEKFEYYKFRHVVNPFGILFHPIALEKCVRFGVDHKMFSDEDVFFHDGRWHCFDAHSAFSHASNEQLLSALNSASRLAFAEISQATHFIITLGTAWAYKNAASADLVANCHKMPQRDFSKELISIDAIAESLSNIVQMIAVANPAANVIFTVSPVRHIKDGFVENQLGKSHLIAGLHQMLARNGVQVSYFPAYEIVMDELRDYRFYAEDMLHPNQTAINYIWERFSEAWISPPAHGIMEKVASIQKALAHRPFDPDSPRNLTLQSNIQNNISALQIEIPHIAF